MYRTYKKDNSKITLKMYDQRILDSLVQIDKCYKLVSANEVCKAPKLTTIVKFED